MKRFIILAGVILLGAVSAVMTALFPRQPMNYTGVAAEDGELTITQQPQSFGSVDFSLKSGFYSENISVELKSDYKNIYFTLDGSDPAPEKGTLYTQPININSSAETKAVTIKAAAINGEGKSGGIFTKSYVVGQDVGERFDSQTLVFVLSTDPYNLYDYEYGIAVPGKIYDEYVEEFKIRHPGEEIPYYADGNYFMTGREWERPIYVEVFESGGKKVIDQAAGVRISGGVSRAVPQKSLRLIARKDYDPQNGKFKYDFFPGAVTESGFPMTEFDRLVLRNGANDREFAGVRDELSQALARDYGYPVTQNCTPAAVFLNGEYYGYAWLHENYNEDYLASYFGGNADNYEIVSKREYPKDGNYRGLSDYYKYYEYYDKDLTDDKIFSELCGLVDIDNLMMYYCMQIFISNKDWPDNNYRAFRYYPQPNEEITSKYRDGRWRFMFYDAEFAWGLYGETPSLNTLSDILSGRHSSGQSKVMTALLKREDMRQKYAAYMADLLAYAFEENNILNTLEELTAASDKEQFYALDKGITSEWANRGTFADSREQIKRFASVRKRVVLRDMRRQFGWDSLEYDVSVSTAAGAVTRLSSQQKKGKGSLWAAYNREVSVPLSAEISDGWSFVRWEINGENYDTPQVILNADMADENGKISARLITEKTPTENAPLQIKRICTRKKAGYITLYNPNTKAATTAGLYLTDDPAKPKRWAIPTVTIPAGGTLVIVADNNKTKEALRQIQADFSLKKNETLVMSDSGGNIISSVLIPDIADGYVYELKDYGEYRLVFSD